MLTPKASREMARVVELYNRKLVNNREFLGLLGRIARPDNLAEIAAQIPTALVESLAKQTAQFRPVLGVGYWHVHAQDRTPDDESFPDPTRLVVPGWHIDDRVSIVGYLRSGCTYAQWRGLSHCRFRCGIPHAQLGSRCLTDGVWVWPEGLAHYVEAHEVCLPEQFAEGMREYGWRIPATAGMPSYDMQGTPDYQFWIAWGRQKQATHTG